MDTPLIPISYPLYDYWLSVPITSSTLDDCGNKSCFVHGILQSTVTPTVQNTYLQSRFYIRRADPFNKTSCVVQGIWENNLCLILKKLHVGEKMHCCFGGPWGTWTPDPLIMSQPLWPNWAKGPKKKTSFVVRSFLQSNFSIELRPLTKRATKTEIFVWVEWVYVHNWFTSVWVDCIDSLTEYPPAVFWERRCH